MFRGVSTLWETAGDALLSNESKKLGTAGGKAPIGFIQLHVVPQDDAFLAKLVYKFDCPVDWGSIDAICAWNIFW